MLSTKQVLPNDIILINGTPTRVFKVTKRYAFLMELEEYIPGYTRTYSFLLIDVLQGNCTIKNTEYVFEC